MNLRNPLNRVMTVAVVVSALAACCVMTALGQDPAGQKAEQQIVQGYSLSESPTVSVANLRIPAAAWRHFDKAKSAADHHREDEFERESAKALAIAPEFASMYLLRATVQMSAHNYDAAVTSAQAAAKADPGAMWTAVVLAGAYNGMHRFHDALLVLDAKRGFEADTWQAMYERARAETGVGSVAAALSYSGMALRSAPREFMDVHLVRANAFVLGNQLSQGVEQMEIYLQAKVPLQHRAEVVAMRDRVKLRINLAQQAALQAEAGQEIATR